MSPRVVGLDLSLSSTGVATIQGGLIGTHALHPKSTGHQRMEFLRSQIALACLHADLIVVEGPSFGSPSSRSAATTTRRYLWWSPRGSGEPASGRRRLAQRAQEVRDRQGQRQQGPV